MDFNQVAGLSPQSQVRVAGVKVGTVDGIKLENGKARITIGLPTDVKEIKPGSKAEFDGTVRDLETELAESTATCTVSAANPMIALQPRPAAKPVRKAKAKKPGKKKR